jgi:hypothetical protein
LCQPLGGQECHALVPAHARGHAARAN